MSPVHRSSVLAFLPLRLRRRLYRVLFAAAVLLRTPWQSGLADHFKRVLRLPHRSALRLDREAGFFDWLAELEWAALAVRSKAGIRRDLSRIRVSHPASVRIVADTGRSVILAPLHMGAYTACLAEMMFRFFPGRSLLILRRRDDMPLETRVMQRIRDFGVDMRFLSVTDRADYLAAMRFARKTSAVVVVFCDLPPSYGMPAAMPMFGFGFSFAFGIDAVARLLDAVVLPISTVAALDGDEIRVGEPFEVRGESGEARVRAVAIIRRHIRTALAQSPEQWHLWATLAEYLPAPGTIAAEAPDETVQFLAEAAE